MHKFEFEDIAQYGKVECLRNRLVGESHPYKGKFRKMRVKYQNLLSCLFTSQTPTVATTVVAHTRKKYGYLKPSMIHGDCTKKELVKFIGEGKIWLEKSMLSTQSATRYFLEFLK